MFCESSSAAALNNPHGTGLGFHDSQDGGTGNSLANTLTEQHDVHGLSASKDKFVEKKGLCSDMLNFSFLDGEDSEEGFEFTELDSDDEDIGLITPFYQGFLLDQLGHQSFDPLAKFCLRHYNDQQNASYEFVELVAVGTQMFPAVYYFTLKVKNTCNDLVTFQAKTMLKRTVVGLGNVDDYTVLDCKISDVPYIEIPPHLLLLHPYEGYEI
ncbi:hypothetical protein ACFE04_021416 [Oxalis oulophora]